MLGVIFTEFVDMVEERFGQKTADEMIDGVAGRLATGGAYTAVGSYDHREVVLLVGQLARLVDVPVPALVRIFGKHLFGRFYALYPEFFKGTNGALDLLELVEDHIHFQVRKLYPDAQLPHFQCSRVAPDVLRMEYRSERDFGELAFGLIEGCGDHFGDELEISTEPLAGGVCFTVQRR